MRSGKSPDRNGYNIRPEWYRLWRDVLLATVRQHDMEFSPGIEVAWYRAIQPEIDIIHQAYYVGFASKSKELVFAPAPTGLPNAARAYINPEPEDQKTSAASKYQQRLLRGLTLGYHAQRW
ncbi:hypothetical protein [Microbulbifer sp. 2205BS26-8]|uniref:hypothetical protein n=1 Tax=Microbulbifer sp. 2205BS26-8 TaxID=3064386 RepID=UPI00273FC463|nr:hypothetical protein [Microbulbifer sp. 2205BS26-8]MDP5210420.1 hypothetical protein [Microbulbifer sp. 2205BS26-8]